MSGEPACHVLGHMKTELRIRAYITTYYVRKSLVVLVPKGNNIPAEFSRGIIEQMKNGCLAGYPLLGIQGNLVRRFPSTM